MASPSIRPCVPASITDTALPRPAITGDDELNAAVNARLNATHDLINRHSMSMMQTSVLRRVLQTKLDGVLPSSAADISETQPVAPGSCTSSLEASPVLGGRPPAGGLSIAQMMQSELARAVAAAAKAPGQPHLPPIFNLGSRMSTASSLSMIGGVAGLQTPSATSSQSLWSPRTAPADIEAETVGHKRKLPPPRAVTPLAPLSQSQCPADRPRRTCQRIAELALAPKTPITTSLPANPPGTEPSAPPRTCLPPADFALPKPASPPPLESPTPLGHAGLQVVTLLPSKPLASGSVDAPLPMPPRIANLKSGCSDGMLLLAATACLVARDDKDGL